MKNIQEAQIKQKFQYDKKHNKVEFQEGNLVLVKDVKIKPKGQKLAQIYLMRKKTESNVLQNILNLYNYINRLTPRFLFKKHNTVIL